ncbi:hypothetical protein [Alsobacter sp. SYSU BS001988]
MSQVQSFTDNVRHANRLIEEALEEIVVHGVPDTIDELRKLAAQCRVRSAFIIASVPPGTQPQPLLEEIADQIDDALATAIHRLEKAVEQGSPPDRA